MMRLNRCLQSLPTLTQMSPLGKQSKEYTHTVKVQGRTDASLDILRKCCGIES